MKPMKIIGRLFALVAAFAALAYVFYRFDPDRTGPARSDEEVSVTVLMGDTPVSMPMAEYLPRVVAAEMPVSFGPQALRAQAVAARTYALRGGRHENADVCTNGCCLAYMDPDALRDFWGGDYAANMRAVTEAVEATDGQVLTWDGELIQAAFHASSAGATEDSAAVWSALPYLVSVETPETPENVPELITTTRVTPEELRRSLDLSPEGPADSWLEDAVPDAAGRVGTLTVCGRTLSGTQVRAALGLKSTAFSVRYDGQSFRFTVAGNGHGVGMSQYGAKLLAQQGLDYEEILSHYYPGTTLEHYEAGHFSGAVRPRSFYTVQLLFPGMFRQTPSSPFSGSVRWSLV